MAAGKALSPDELIAANIVAKTASGCWVWRLIDAYGYGRVFVGGREYKAHRFVFEYFARPIPVGLDLDHLCPTRDETCPGGRTCPHRACVNPDHLEPATRAENTRRGRSLAVAVVRSGECINGHPLEDEVIGGDGPSAGRRKPCNACARDRYARNMQDPEWRARRAEYSNKEYRRSRRRSVNQRPANRPGSDVTSP
jgi:hypothetical protein